MYVRRAVACKTVMFTAAELGTNGRGVRCSKNGETMSAEGTLLGIYPLRVDNTIYLDICTVYLPHLVCIVAWPGTDRLWSPFTNIRHYFLNSLESGLFSQLAIYLRPGPAGDRLP